MANLRPWMALAGLGAFHGLNPANGWMFAAAWGAREGGGAQVRRALLPIAIGHSASVAIVAGALALGMALDRTLAQGLAGALVLALAAVGVHTAAMLVATGVIATGVCRGLAMHPRLRSGTAPRHAWTAALAVTGVLLTALR